MEGFLSWGGYKDVPTPRRGALSQVFMKLWKIKKPKKHYHSLFFLFSVIVNDIENYSFNLIILLLLAEITFQV